MVHMYVKDCILRLPLIYLSYHIEFNRCTLNEAKNGSCLRNRTMLDNHQFLSYAFTNKKRHLLLFTNQVSFPDSSMKLSMAEARGFTPIVVK